MLDLVMSAIEVSAMEFQSMTEPFVVATMELTVPKHRQNILLSPQRHVQSHTTKGLVEQGKRGRKGSTVVVAAGAARRGGPRTKDFGGSLLESSKPRPMPKQMPPRGRGPFSVVTYSSL